ncbi:MAG TPA: hypothetical protein VFY87_22795, partial [Geminicoccaceae bacterium]|nr:hypothetical protein [Geminicoccaceae bacterium]
MGVVMPLGYPSILAAASPGARDLTVPSCMRRRQATPHHAGKSRRHAVAHGTATRQAIRSLAVPASHPF